MTAFVHQFPYLTNAAQGVRRRIGVHVIGGDKYVCTTVSMRASAVVTVSVCVCAVCYVHMCVRVNRLRACVRILGVCIVVSRYLIIYTLLYNLLLVQSKSTISSGV